MSQWSHQSQALATIRKGEKNDLPFIYATWLKGLRWGNRMFEYIDQELYFKNYQKVVEALLESPGTQINVAVLKEDPAVILGYSVSEGDRLHWVHVKKAWREIGIAKTLVPPETSSISHVTDVAIKILSKQKKRIIFNPFL